MKANLSEKKYSISSNTTQTTDRKYVLTRTLGQTKEYLYLVIDTETGLIQATRKSSRHYAAATFHIRPENALGKAPAIIGGIGRLDLVFKSLASFGNAERDSLIKNAITTTGLSGIAYLMETTTGIDEHNAADLTEQAETIEDMALIMESQKREIERLNTIIEEAHNEIVDVMAGLSEDPGMATSDLIVNTHTEEWLYQDYVQHLKTRQIKAMDEALFYGLLHTGTKEVTAQGRTWKLDNPAEMPQALKEVESHVYPSTLRPIAEMNANKARRATLLQDLKDLYEEGYLYFLI